MGALHINETMLHLISQWRPFHWPCPYICVYVWCMHVCLHLHYVYIYYFQIFWLLYNIR